MLNPIDKDYMKFHECGREREKTKHEKTHEEDTCDNARRIISSMVAHFIMWTGCGPVAPRSREFEEKKSRISDQMLHLLSHSLNPRAQVHLCML